MVANTKPRNPHWKERRKQHLPNVLALVESGVNTAEIARRLGIGRKMVESCLHDLGIENQTAGTMRIEKRRRLHCDIRALYAEGVSVLEMARRLEVPRTTIVLCLGELDLTPRTGSEANLIRMAKLSAGQRKDLVRAANLKSRATGRSREAQINSARRRQHGLASVNVGIYEREINDHLAELGFETIPQFAFGVHNIDIYVPARRCAVEVYTSGMRPVQTGKAAKKAMQILSAGMNLAEIWIARTKGETASVRMHQQLIAFLESVCPTPSGLGQYRVIRGHGDIDTISQTYLDDWADIAIAYRRLQSHGRDAD